VLSGADVSATTGTTAAQAKASKRQRQQQQMAAAGAANSVPWVLCGHSMGGAVALCAGHEVWQKRCQAERESGGGGGVSVPSLYRNFAGCAVVRVPVVQRFVAP